MEKFSVKRINKESVVAGDVAVPNVPVKKSNTKPKKWNELLDEEDDK